MCGGLWRKVIADCAGGLWSNECRVRATEEGEGGSLEAAVMESGERR